MFYVTSMTLAEFFFFWFLELGILWKVHTFLQWNFYERCLSLNLFISYLFTLKKPSLHMLTSFKTYWEWWYYEKNLWAKIWAWLSCLNFCIVEGSERTLEPAGLIQLTPAITGYLSSSQGSMLSFLNNYLLNNVKRGNMILPAVI